MTFNLEKYGELLVSALPVSIKTGEEHERMIQVVGDFMRKGNLSPEEERLVELLTDIIVDYEERIYEPVKKESPIEMLRFLMSENNLKQRDMLPVFGSEGIISEVLNGKRGINANHARKLAEFFSVSPDFFI